MTIFVRKITLEDRPAWQALFEAYLTFYKTSRPAEVIEVAFERMTSGKDNEFQGYVAEQDGKTVGFTHFLEHRKMWDVENTVYLMDLFVVPECRNLGVARRLIHGVYEYAKQNNASGVYWLTHESNHTAMALYDKVATNSGFVKYAYSVK